jgi:hypothetical protein
MLDAVKRTLDITITAYDTELTELIAAALQDLRATAGVVAATPDSTDPLILAAVKLYCQMRFKQPANYAELERAYNDIKGSLQKATGYTDWGDGT